MPPVEDLTGRSWDARVVVGRGERSPCHRNPLWRVECRACGDARNLNRHDVLARKPCKVCGNRAKGLIRTAASRAHAATLSQHRWPRRCPTCGVDFLGTARQVYHAPGCRPPAARR